MNRKEKIENEVKKTLDMFENKKNLKPNPFFYTRIQQSLKSKSHRRVDLLSYLKPAFMAGLFVINVGTFLWYFDSSDSITSGSNQKDLIEILSGDLNPGISKNNLFLTEID